MMIRVALREILVLLIGCVLAWVVSLAVGDAGRNFGALAASILVPIAFCLGRAAMVRPPMPQWSAARRVGYQVAVGIALVMLLVFEMGTPMLLGVADVPVAAWGVLAVIGIAYATLFCVAHHFGFSGGRSQAMTTL